MYVDTTSYINSTYIPSTDEGTASSELDQDAFLSLLTSELQNQDPLEPMDNSDMVSQLAEFANLEQITAMSETLSDVSTLLAGQSVMLATSYIGMEVTAGGNTLSKQGDSVTGCDYTLPYDADKLSVSIYNEDGNIVTTETVGATEAGTHSFKWDGTDFNGNAAPDGNYRFVFAAQDANGESFPVSTEITGTVSGVTTENGQTVLELEDGRTISIANIWDVRKPAES